MSSGLSDYDYDLPRQLIAQRPSRRRQDSRMMVLRRNEQTIEHRRFAELKMFLGPRRWKCLVKPGRKMRVGGTTKIDNVTLRVEEILPEGERVVSVDKDVDL